MRREKHEGKETKTVRKAMQGASQIQINVVNDKGYQHEKAGHPTKFVKAYSTTSLP